MCEDTWKRYCDAVHKLRELEGPRRMRLARLRTNAQKPAGGTGQLAQEALRALASGLARVGACKLEGVG